MSWKKILRMDERIIYIVATFAVVLPMFFPVGFPVARDPSAVTLYNYVSDLPAGSPIIYSFDLEASGTTELKPATLVLIDLSLQRGHRIFLMALQAQGPGLARVWTDPIFARHNAEYGVDWLDIGYISASASFMELSRTDLLNAWNNRDYTGQRLDTFPIMEGLVTGNDIAALCSITTGSPGILEWVGGMGAIGVIEDILGVGTAVLAPGNISLYTAGLMKGLANGLNGAATLEACHGAPGSAHGNSDAQSFAHLAIIAFVILGNIAYFSARRAGDIS